MATAATVHESANGRPTFGPDSLSAKAAPVASAEAGRVGGGDGLQAKSQPSGRVFPAASDNSAAGSGEGGPLLTSGLSINTKVVDAPAVCYSPRPPPSALIQVRKNYIPP